MEQTIYGDVLFAVNFSMDFLALFLTGKILHAGTKTLRTAVSAAVGGIYAAAVLFTGGSRLIELALSLCAAALMCFICYSPKSAKALLKETLLFYGVNFLLGGCMTGLYSLMNVSFGKKVAINGEAGTVYGDVNAGKFIPLALFAAVISLVIGRIFSSSAAKREVSVTIVSNGKRKTVNCLADSGNLLREPAGGLPVIVTAYRAAEEILPPGLRRLFKNGDLSDMKDLPLELAGKIRIIPVESVVPGMCVMPGYVPDEIIISGEKKKACIGIDTRENGDFGGCSGIVPTALI